MNINFLGRRKLWYLLSLLFVIPGLVSLFTQGLNLGIDFTGGNIIQVQFKETVSSSQVRAVLDEQGLSGSSVQSAGEAQFLLRTRELTEAENDDLLAGMKDKLGQLEVLRNEKVGGAIGQELTRNAILALLIASVLMVIYITVRFEFFFAIAAIIALLHDVLVTLGVFSLFRFQLDSSFVAAVLTIIGYSINDTIVIFDRIRENLHGHKKDAVERIANDSINQTMRRSIATVTTVVIALIALLVLGGETTKVFAGAMLIGTLSGSYSSVCVASPLWVDLRNMAQGRRKGGKVRKATAH